MRSYIRHPSDIPIEYQADEHAESVSQEHLHDISAGGLSFTSTHALTAGSLINIRISNVEPDFVAGTGCMVPFRRRQFCDWRSLY